MSRQRKNKGIFERYAMKCEGVIPNTSIKVDLLDRHKASFKF